MLMNVCTSQKSYELKMKSHGKFAKAVLLQNPFPLPPFWQGITAILTQQPSKGFYAFLHCLITLLIVTIIPVLQLSRKKACSSVTITKLSNHTQLDRLASSEHHKSTGFTNAFKLDLTVDETPEHFCHSSTEKQLSVTHQGMLKGQLLTAKLLTPRTGCSKVLPTLYISSLPERYDTSKLLKARGGCQGDSEIEATFSGLYGMPL